MEQIFQGEDAVSVDVEREDAAKKEEKKKKLNEMKALFDADLQKDPTLMARMHTMSNNIKVVNVLGYGKSGNVVVDKSQPEGRNLIQASQNVGYKIQNVGTEPISYETEIWTKGEDGLYHGEKVTKTMAPNEVVDLTKEYLARLAVHPEFFLRFQNGMLKRNGSKNKTTIQSLKDQLNSFYFVFSKDSDGSTVNVNDDDVKIAIDVDEVVTDQYVATFGFLNNPKTTGKGKGSKAGSKGSGITAQDVFANYIRNLIEQGEEM